MESVSHAVSSVMESFNFSKGVHALYDAILAETLGKDNKKAEARKKELQKQITKIEERITNIQSLLMDDHLSPEAFREMKTRCDQELQQARLEMAKLNEKDPNMASKLRKGVHILKNMSNTFKAANDGQKAALARAVFPESLFFDGTKCRTPRINSVLALLLSLDVDSSGNKKGRIPENLEFSPQVEPGGVEPPSKQGQTQLSTCLSRNWFSSGWLITGNPPHGLVR